MKPAVTISLVVVAVLTTVVIEEVRIKKLRAEILRLGSIPTNQPVSITPEEILARETPLPGTPPAKPVPFEESEPAPVPNIPSDDDTSDNSDMELPSLRKVPEDYPKPSEDEIKQAALGPYSALHYELGLLNHERVYFDYLLGQRQSKQQALVQTWVAAGEDERTEIEQEMASELAKNDEAIRHFLQREKDFEQFATYHAMQPERMLVAQLIPLMDQQGVSLEMEDEQKLVTAMHEARMAAKGIDWNSAEALQAVVAGDAKARFEKEWKSRTESLATKLPDFLDEKTTEVVLNSREQLKMGMDEALDSAIEAINGEAPDSADE